MPLPPITLAGIDAGLGPSHQLLIHRGGRVQGDACLAQQHKALVEGVKYGLLQYIAHSFGG